MLSALKNTHSSPGRRLVATSLISLTWSFLGAKMARLLRWSGARAAGSPPKNGVQEVAGAVSWKEHVISNAH